MVIFTTVPYICFNYKRICKRTEENLSVLGKSFDLCALPDDFKEV